MAAVVISVPVLILSYLMGWALWRLMNDGYLGLEPTPLKSMHTVLDAQNPKPRTDALPEEATLIQSPATNRLHIPPPYYSSQRIGRTGFSLSSSGPSDWSFQHRLTPRHYRRRHALDLPMYQSYFSISARQRKS